MAFASFVAWFVGALLGAYGLTLATAELCACRRHRPASPSQAAGADPAPDDAS